ncbi:MAG: glycosyltransferase [Salibacteraceae bacterium]
MQDLKISVVMAAKNVEPYLEACLDSILAQTYENWELIVVDDHSTDRTHDIIQQYGSRDARIRCYRSEGEKLNPALITDKKYIDGDLVNRMDADDLMPKYKLEVMHEAWIEHGRGFIAAGGTQHFVDEGEVGDGFIRYDAWLNQLAENGTHYQEIYRECVIPSHCWLIHRDDFMTIGGFQDVYPEDYDLCFRFYQNNLEIIPINKVLHHWRDRSDRISRTWEVYKDNRYFELKLQYFFEIDYDQSKHLVVWGAGRNGKDLVKAIQKRGIPLSWVSNNSKKVGKEIYGIVLNTVEWIFTQNDAQLLIAVSNPEEQTAIRRLLQANDLEEARDFWFFL